MSINNSSLTAFKKELPYLVMINFPDIVKKTEVFMLPVVRIGPVPEFELFCHVPVFIFEINSLCKVGPVEIFLAAREINIGKGKITRVDIDFPFFTFRNFFFEPVGEKFNINNTLPPDELFKGKKCFKKVGAD